MHARRQDAANLTSHASVILTQQLPHAHIAVARVSHANLLGYRLVPQDTDGIQDKISWHWVPDKSTIHNFVWKLEKTGILLDERGKYRRQVTLADVCAGLRDFPETFASTVPWSKVWAIQTDSFPPTVGTRQAETSSLLPTVSGLLSQFVGILDTTRLMDEAWFQVSGYVNSHNSRIWSAENSFVVHTEPLHPEEVSLVRHTWSKYCRFHFLGRHCGQHSIFAHF